MTGRIRSVLSPYRCFEAVTVAAILALTAFGIVGLAAADLGIARPAVVWPISLVLWLVLLTVWRPDRPSRPDLVRTVPVAALLVGLVVIAISGGTNAANNGQYVRADRDNGIYTSAAFWIANRGDVLVEGRGGPHRDLADVRADSIGQALHDGSDSQLEIHGTHLFPSLVAQGKWLGGFRGIQVMPAIIGVLALAFFLLLALWFLPAWIAVLVTSTLAVNFVFVYGVRSNLTEPLSLAFTAAGLWMVLAASRSTSGVLGRHAVAGAVFATTLAVRVDAGVILAFVVPGVALLALLRAEPGVHGPLRRFGAFVAGGLPVLAVVGFDLFVKSPGYAGDLAGRIRMIEVALLAGTVVSFLTIVSVGRAGRSTRRRIVERWSRHRMLLLRIGPASVAIVFGLLAFVRPLLGRVHRTRGPGGMAAMERIQTAEGFEPDGTLSYDELSLDRLGWYLGTLAIVLGVVGLVFLVHRLLERRDGEAGLLIAGVLPTTLLYVWNPSIFPDQPWMMRRYLPVIIPGLLLLAGIAIAAIHRRLRDRIPESGRRVPTGAVVAIAALVLLVPPLRITAPLAGVRWQAGGYQGVDKVCHEVGDDALLLFSSRQQVGSIVMSPIRSICDLPTLRFTGHRLEPDGLAKIREATEASGRRLWIVGLTEEELREWYPDATNVRFVRIYETTRLRPTLHLPPRDLVPHTLALFLAEVRS